MCGSTRPGRDRAASGVEPGEPPERQPFRHDRGFDGRSWSDRGDAALPARDDRGVGRVRSAGVGGGQPRRPRLARAGTEAAGERRDLGGPDDEEAGRRLVDAAALDDPERAGHGRVRALIATRPARAASSRSSSAWSGEKSRSRRNAAAAASRASIGILARRPGVVGDREERRQRREADELRLGELDAILGGDLADRLPDHPQRGDLEVEDVHRDLRAARAPRSRTRCPGPSAGRRPTRGCAARSASRARRPPTRG